MSDLSDDYSHVGDYELRQELIKWDKLRNRRANKSLKMPPTDIGTSSKLPANGKDNGYGAPPENAQLKRNIETKMGTTDSEEKKKEPKENRVPPNEKCNGNRSQSNNAKEKNAQLKREIKEILGIIDSDEKETEPKGKKFCEMFSWVQLFFCLAFLLLSFAVFYCCASNKTQTCPTNTPIHSNSSSVPSNSNVPEPPFLVVWYPVLNAIVFYIVTCSVIVVYIAGFSLLVYMFCMSRRFSAIAKREEAEKMNDLYAKIEAEIDEEELEMAEFDANLRWDET